MSVEKDSLAVSLLNSDTYIVEKTWLKKPLPPAADDPGIGPQHTAADPQPGLWKPANQRKFSRKFEIWVLKSPSFFRSSSTLRIEWITVE